MTAAGGTGIGYDGRGNLTSSGASTYQYTSDNRLATTGSGVYLANDGAGRLVQVYANGGANVTPMDYLGQTLISEFNGSNQLIRRYVHGPGADEPLVWYEGSGIPSSEGTGLDRRWLHTDERGSVIAVSNASGSSIATNSYDEYGIPASTNIGRFGYTGQAWLSELGMWYYKARMYSPTLGRFMQTDPIGYADGINWYNYVGSDPINATDPSGLTGDIAVTGFRSSVAPQPPLSFQTIFGNGLNAAAGIEDVENPHIFVTAQLKRNRTTSSSLGSTSPGTDLIDSCSVLYVLDFTGKAADAATVTLLGCKRDGCGRASRSGSCQRRGRC